MTFSLSDATEYFRNGEEPFFQNEAIDVTPIKGVAPGASVNDGADFALPVSVKNPAKPGPHKYIKMPVEDSEESSPASRPSSPLPVQSSSEDEEGGGKVTRKVTFDEQNLVKPHRSAMLYGHEQEDEGLSAASKEEDELPIKQMFGKNLHKYYNERKLGFHRKQGVLNSLPTNSLVVEDFKKRKLTDLYARAAIVAESVGASKLVARIGSDRRLRVDGALTITEWWRASTKEQRFLALTRASNFNGSSLPEGATRLLIIPCPFRDAGLD
jgi:hypothetical protein